MLFEYKSYFIFWREASWNKLPESNVPGQSVILAQENAKPKVSLSLPEVTAVFPASSEDPVSLAPSRAPIPEASAGAAKEEASLVPARISWDFCRYANVKQYTILNIKIDLLN